MIANNPLHLAVIVGSTREGRFGDIVGRWFVGQAELRDDMLVDVIDLLDVNLPTQLSSQASPAVREYIARLDRADAFVIVTPEYNHGYPASLKQAIDVAYAEWRAKPVGFVSYGGMAGGLRAVEQLRQVFAELHTMTVRDTVSFHNVWPLFDESTGEPHDPSGCNPAAAAMLDQIAWWATALRTARESTTTMAHNREAFRRLYEEAVSKGDLDVIDEVVNPDVVHHTAYDAQARGPRASWPPSIRRTPTRTPGSRGLMPVLDGHCRHCGHALRLNAENPPAAGGIPNHAEHHGGPSVTAPVGRCRTGCRRGRGTRRLVHLLPLCSDSCLRLRRSRRR